MKHLDRLVTVIAFALPLSLVGCASDTSSNRQLVECKVAADGTVSSCVRVAKPSNAPGTCTNVEDEDDDEAGEVDDDDDAAVTGAPDDEDDDGIADPDDDDDDNDGVDDDHDCDEVGDDD